MPFTPNHGLPIEERLRRLEAALANLDGRLNTFNDFGLPGVDGAEGVAPYPAKVGGDTGGGGGGETLQQHDLLGDYHDDVTAAAPVRGDVITAQGATPKWGRLALGTSGQVLRSDGTDAAWSSDQHNLLSSRHGDTTAASVVRGDLITGQGATPKFARLAIGASGRVLKSNGTDIAWGQTAFSELTGTLSGGQHGNLVSVAGTTADHSGTISANARLQAAKNGTNIGAPAPTFDFIEGVGITLTILQPSGNTTIQIDSEAKTQFDGWYQSDISTAPTSDTAMAHPTGVSAVRMYGSGTLVGVVVTLDGTVGSAGNDYTVTVYRWLSDGSAFPLNTGITATLTGGVIPPRSATGTGSVTFTSTARLEIQEKRTGTPNARKARAYLLVIFD